MKTFDLPNSPLEGTNLIEASAGTGKTHTLTGLFLRLILEQHLSVDKILVVTFTEAATEELKERIRGRLREAAKVFSDFKSKDAFLNTLLQRHPDPQDGFRRLENAVRDFDEAAIFTIHGFCRRMLHEYAFESGSLFDSEMVGDQQSLLREIVEDFWRRNLYNESPLFVNYILGKKTSPEKLLLLLKNKVSRLDLKIIPQEEVSDTSDLEKAFRETFRRVRELWLSEKTKIEDILINNNSLNRSSYKKESVPKWLQMLDDYLTLEENNPLLFKEFEKFTASKIKASTNKKCTSPSHPFFDLCDDLKSRQQSLEAAFKKRLTGLKHSLFEYAKAEIRKRKEAQNMLSFDDLLLDMHAALRKGGEALAEGIRSRFKAALIDEFQDTDPVQYEIFKRIFHHQDSILFLIGDPKQAIFGFRGADIFAYMDAARHAEARYTLAENWRSEPDLISGVNAMFENSDAPFIYNEIQFHSIAAADKDKRVCLKIDGKPEPPLQLWFIKTGEGKPVNKPTVEKVISKATAAEISRLLDRNRNVFIGDEPLTPRDIAVLVRQNAEAEVMKKSLSELNIPAVLHSTANIFDSPEALEIERILSAVIASNNEKRIKTALASEMMGVKGEELDALTADESAWEQWFVRFGEYRRIWDSSGFIRMFRLFVSREKILPRLMSMPDGERRATNLLHLTEILHQTAVEKKLGMAWLVKWLAEQRHPNSPRLEEHQMRLESDENAVRLVTVHKSKGLEYPIVFCPFMYNASKKSSHSKEDFHLFHDGNDKGCLTLELDVENEAHQPVAEREQLAESLRLLYVALTRAKHRCYLVWGRINEAETSASAYLFHHPEMSEDIVASTGANFGKLKDENVLADLKAIQHKAPKAVNVSELPEGEGRRYSPFSEETASLDCQQFTSEIAHHFNVSSFSSLVFRRAHSAELADYDAQPEPYQSEDSEEAAVRETSQDIFSFPKGARAGKCLHEIFEHIDFTNQDLAATENLTEEKLRAYNFDRSWQPAVCEMIRNVLSIPLDAGQGDFTLSRVRNEDRLNELEFYFPLREISPKKLGRIFERYAGSELPADFPSLIGELDFAAVQGFMKGFIDMVFQFRDKFYLVDWKSNFLGNRVEDYHQDALAEAMKTNFYILQYHIYTLALHQYLSVRKEDYSYQKDFGGVYYIFLRGIDPEKGAAFGVYQAKPPELLISELGRELIG
jgi:exodeoxyribonuclease V beta subunit